MSSLWTPSGERPVPRPGDEEGGDRPGRPSAPSEPAGGSESAPPAGDRPTDPGQAPNEAELRERMDELRQQLADTPARTVVANHCYGMFELAALHLSLDPPNLDEARLAIDSLGLLVEGLTSRLGEEEVQLREGLTQLRLAFVRLGGSPTADEPKPSDESSAGG